MALSDPCNVSIVETSLEKLEQLRLSGTKHQIIAVAISINHGQRIRSLYEARGYRAEIIHSKLDEEKQEEIIRDLKNGSLDCIVQVQMLGDPTRCDCPWYGKYKGIYKGLANWCGQSVDPRKKEHAKVVLNRLKTAIDKRECNSEGEQQSQGSGQRFSDFVQEWKTHYAEEYGLTSTSLAPMLGVVKEGFETCTLEHLSGASLQIERWLNKVQKERNWTDNTWNRYYELLSTLFHRATRWKANGVPRMAQNPMLAIERRVGTKKSSGSGLRKPLKTNYLLRATP